MALDPSRWQRLSELFHQALAVPDHQRRAFLESACADDPQLLADTLALLEEDARGASVLDRDLGRVARDILDGSVPGAQQIGPYRVTDVLGRGGMGVVYLAERPDLQSRVAIKVLRDASLSPARRERFEREQQTLAQLNHPSIARLYDADALPDGTPYFVMEFVDGVPLTAYCETHRCTVGERLRLFRAVGEAVQYAHRQAVIHRDLKPSNILVAKGDPDGAPSVKLLDFGIAKQLESIDTPAAQTQAETRLLTPGYAAPEQILGHPVGVYTDVYALGVLLYEMLTGEHPHDLDGLTPGQVEAVIQESEPDRPSVKARSADAEAAGVAGLSTREWADLDVLCLTAMHKDPHRRYSTVEALLRDLDRFLHNEPLEARPDTLGYRAGKFLRRNRRQVAAAAFVGVALLGLVSFHTAQLAHQRDLAHVAAEKAERISEYLIGLFEAGDPYAQDPESLDVSTLLARGEARADELADQPAVQAAMLTVLGRVHTQLSDYDRAGPLLERALELRRQGGEPVDLAETLSSLASLLLDRGDYAGAEAALREALGLRERHLPPNHPDLATNLSDLGTALRYQGRYQDAETLHRLAVRMRRAIHQTPHEELGFSLNRLAVVLFQQGQYGDAERYYREALAVSVAVFGPDHPSVTRTLANLGKLYEEVGDYVLADSLLTEALRIRRATLGNDHFETAVGLGQLAGLFNTMGEYDRAEAHLRESLAIRERILPPGHPSIATTVNGLATAMQRRGEYDEAETLFRRAADIYREGLGPRHRFTAIALSNLAHVLSLKGELEAARTHYRDALSILEEVHPADHQELAHNRSRYGGVLAAMGRHEEAEPTLLRAYRTLDAQLGSGHQRTREAARRVVELYEVWDRIDEADPYRLAAETPSGRRDH
jgi:eukaryotic-like serine/threonine-protein kinase